MKITRRQLRRIIREASWNTNWATNEIWSDDEDDLSSWDNVNKAREIEHQETLDDLDRKHWDDLLGPTDNPKFPRHRGTIDNR